MPSPLSKITTIALASALLAWAWAFALVPAAHAQTNFDPRKIKQVINIFDATVSYPAPSWQRSINVQNEHEFYRDQKGNQFLFEMIPKGEAFTAWSKMLVVAGLQQPAGANMDLGLFAKKQLVPFVRICDRESFSVQKLTSTRDVLTYIVYCTDSPGGPTNIGYGPGVGELALITFRKAGRTFIKVVHEWRGPRYTGADRNSWPVKYDTLMDMIGRFQKITVKPKP